MRKLLVALLAVFLVPTICWGQNKPQKDGDQVYKYYHRQHNWYGSNWGGGGGGGWGYNGYGHASTAAEGYYSGVARYARSQGAYLRNASRAWINGEIARSMRIQNHRDAVHTWWQLKDEYKERFRREHPTWPERQEKRFDMAIRVHEVKEKEKKLIAAGILPPKPASSFTFRGRTYKSYAEFKNSPDWIGMRLNTLYSAQQKEKRQRDKDERFRKALLKFDESRKTLKGSTY